MKYSTPILCGFDLTEDILKIIPDPYPIIPPETGEMPDVFYAGSLWTVSEKFRTIIESLEPRIHGFIPINLIANNANARLGDYYPLHVTQVLDAIVIESTRFIDGMGIEGFKKNPTLSPFSPPALNAAAISGKHLWRGARCLRFGQPVPPFAFVFFCSDALKKTLEYENIKGWTFQPCKLL